MALPKMTCPISQARKDQITHLFKDKVRVETSALWNDACDNILKELPGYETMRTLAQYRVPGLITHKSIKVISPDFCQNEIENFELLTALSDIQRDEYDNVISSKSGRAIECRDKILETLSSTSFEIPEIKFKKSKGVNRINLVLLTEQAINHILQAEKIYKEFYFRAYASNLKRITETFWSKKVYYDLFGLETYYTVDDRFYQIADGQYTCNISQYLTKAKEYMETHDSIAKVEYFSLADGVVDSFEGGTKTGLIFLLLKTPKIDQFEKQYKSLILSLHKEKNQLDTDIATSSVFRTLANKPQGKQWMKYFSLADHVYQNKRGDGTKVFYSPVQVKKALEIIKASYNPNWHQTVNQMKLLGISPNYSQYTNSFFPVYFVKSTFLAELLPWLEIVKNTVEALPTVKTLSNLAKEFPGLQTFSRYTLNLGYNDFNGSWASNLQLECKLAEPVLAVGASYYGNCVLKLPLFCSDWDSPATGTFGPAHLFFEKVPLLAEVIGEISAREEEYERAMQTILDTLQLCRINSYKSAQDEEMETLIWNEMKDYFDENFDQIFENYHLTELNHVQFEFA